MNPRTYLRIAPRLYVAGPMTGLPEYNYPAYHRAEQTLTAAGFVVLNPARNQPVPRDASKGVTWSDYMRASLGQLAAADGVAVLDGWAASRGAALEVHIASQLGLLVDHVDVWRARTGSVPLGQVVPV